MRCFRRRWHLVRRLPSLTSWMGEHQTSAMRSVTSKSSVVFKSTSYLVVFKFDKNGGESPYTNTTIMLQYPVITSR